MNIIYKTIATSFGLGYAPIAPGTVGAMGGVALLWFASLGVISYKFHTFQMGFLILIVLTTVIGAWATKQLEQEWGEDPSKVVIDEVVGVWIALFWLPLNWPHFLIGFCLFRLFDIWKPLGIRKLEKIPNGWGVMLDDVAAGIYANICLQLISRLVLYPSSFYIH